MLINVLTDKSKIALDKIAGGQLPLANDMLNINASNPDSFDVNGKWERVSIATEKKPGTMQYGFKQTLKMDSNITMVIGIEMSPNFGNIYLNQYSYINSSWKGWKTLTAS